MAIDKSRPMKFVPRGVTDAFDASDKFIGACQALTNLTFDQANPELVRSRPGVVTLENLRAGGMANATFISIQVGIGERIYGMVATTRNAGHDEPFIYDASIGALVTISGITAANTPVSPATTGDWVPPTLTVVGTMVLVTHPGFPGTGGHFFGMFDITNFNAPAWSSINTATNALPEVPVAVANFNNRAWFAVAPSANFPANQVFYTDVLTNPPTITNATQFLVIGDASPITALSGLPVTTSSSGVIGALSIFKARQVWQITGDTTTNNLSEAQVSQTIGTESPRTIANCPFGLYFSGAGGPYLLDNLGLVRSVTNSSRDLEPDINQAFQNAITPSRWAGAYTATTYRVCGETTLRGVSQFVDYWFDEHKRRWNGPHTFVYDCATPFQSYFVLSSANNPGLLCKSEPVQTVSSVYTDLGSIVNFRLLSSTFPKTNEEMMKQVAESTIELAATGDVVLYRIEAQNEQGQSMGDVEIAVADGAIWGYFLWGSGFWGGSHLWGGGGVWGLPPVGSGMIWGEAEVVPHTFPVNWAAPLVFDKMQLQVTGQASGAAGIGTFYARYQNTGYQSWLTSLQTQSFGVANGG